MRIAILADASLTHITRWCNYFAGRGHDVLLITFEKPADSNINTVKLTPYLPTKLGGYLSRFLSVKAVLKSFKPHLLNSLYISGYGFLGALTKVKPFVVSSLGSDLLVDYQSSFIHIAHILYALKKADLVTVDAENLKQRVLTLGISESRILKFYFGIDGKIFNPPDNSKKEKPIIISTRKLYPLYNVNVLLEAAEEIIKEFPSATFVICGSGPEEKPLKRKAQDLGMAGKFIFKGTLSQHDLADELKKATIYVSTSLSDSTSVSLLEAMACGTLPVVSDIEANREWINDSRNGLLFKPGDSKDLSRAIIRALKDNELRSRATEINLDLIQEKGLWETNMAMVEEKFNRLIENRNK